MRKRLKVVFGELAEIHEAAQRRAVTVSGWVRQVLRMARRDDASGDPGAKLAVVRAAVRHNFPTADIDEMLDEIARGSRDS